MVYKKPWKAHRRKHRKVVNFYEKEIRSHKALGKRKCLDLLSVIVFTFLTLQLLVISVNNVLKKGPI